MHTTRGAGASRTSSIAVLAGDGIGREVMPAAQEVVEATARGRGVDPRWTKFDWCCETYLRTGGMVPEDGLQQLRPHDAVLLGPVGYPGVLDHVSLWGLLIPIRRTFQQYVNLCVPSGCFRVSRARCGRSGRARWASSSFERTTRESTPRWAGASTPAHHRRPLSRRRCSPGSASSVSCAAHTAWRSGADIRWTRRRSRTASSTPCRFGTRLSRRWAPGTPASRRTSTTSTRWPPSSCSTRRGSTSWSPRTSSATFSPTSAQRSSGASASPRLPTSTLNESSPLFEPVHGSAPGIAGTGIANPIGQIWSGAVMLEHLGHPEAAADIMKAIEGVLSHGHPRTRGLGGDAGTAEVTRAILDRLPPAA